MVTEVPGWLLRHCIDIEPYLGDSAYGPRYGERTVCVPALVADVRKQVADKDGREVLATAQVITGAGIECPPGSRVTLPDGRTATAISSAKHTAPGLPVPACTEVMCQ